MLSEQQSPIKQDPAKTGKRMPVHRWWDGELVHHLHKSVWQFLKQVEIRLHHPPCVLQGAKASSLQIHADIPVCHTSAHAALAMEST